MKREDILREALALAFSPLPSEGKKWRKKSDREVKKMWELYKAALAGPVQTVVETEYFSSLDEITPPQDVWALYLEADAVLAESEKRRAEREDELWEKIMI